MNFTIGTCFKNTNTPPPPQHYWFVLSEPTAAKNVIIANITSWSDSCDDASCRLKNGDHSCILKDCYVNYGDAKLVGLGILENLLQTKLVVIYEKACDDLLQLMQQGALESEHCKNWAKKILRSQNLPRL